MSEGARDMGSSAARADVGSALVVSSGRATVAKAALWGIGLTNFASSFIKRAWPAYQEHVTWPIPGFKRAVYDGMRWVEPNKGLLTGLAVATGALVLVALVVWLAARKRESIAQISIEGDVLLLQRGRWTRKIALSDIASITTAGGRTTLQQRNGKTISVSGEPGEALRRALDERRPKVDTVAVPHNFRQLPLGNGISSALSWLGFAALLAGWNAAGSAFGKGSIGAVVLISMLTAAWLGAAAWLARDKIITVGTDGVRVGGSGKHRFVSFSRVKEIEGQPERLALRMNDGSAVVLARNEPGLEQRLREAFQAFQELDQTPAEDHARLLHRGERTPEAWRTDLQKLAHTQDYRAEGLDADVLANLVSDARVDPEQRVAAALALPKSPEARSRIRIAAQGSADEDVQRALAAAADDEIAEAELARAMRRRA